MTGGMTPPLPRPRAAPSRDGGAARGCGRAVQTFGFGSGRFSPVYSFEAARSARQRPRLLKQGQNDECPIYIVLRLYRLSRGNFRGGMKDERRKAVNSDELRPLDELRPSDELRPRQR